MSGFIGWENSGALAEESKNPRRYIPVVKHILVPLAGSAVLIYGIYEFVQPDQPAPANVYWAWILGIVILSALAAAFVYLRRPADPRLAGTIGPEFVPEVAP